MGRGKSERTRSGWSAVALALLAGCGGGSSPSGGCGDPLFIDDLEDGDRLICASAGRHGAWSVAGDGTSTNLSPSGEFTATLIPDERDGSRYGARMTGFGFTNWGAAMNVSLNGAGASVAPSDASAYDGVRFWMKSDAAVYVQFLLPETVASGEPGGTCVDDPTEYNCGNHFGFSISAPPPGEWQEYDVPFSAVLQRSGKVDANFNNLIGSAVWDPRQLLGIQFVANAGIFDLWLDDLRFYRCAASSCVPTCTDPALPVACPGAEGVAAGCWPAATDCSKVLPLNLFTMCGSGPNDVWAVGYRGVPNLFTPPGIIIHWDGSAWSISAEDLPGGMSGVWGSAPDDVWAGGGNGALLHWNGQAWSAVDSGTEFPIFDLWGSGPDDVWAVAGAGTILHWDGSQWSSTFTGEAIDIYRVWGSGAADVWAAGNPPEFYSGSVLHWEGAQWSTDVVEGATSGPTGVWGSGPADVWVVGYRGEIVHWDGTAWTPIPSGTDEWLTDVWGNGPDDVWAVGDRGTILHWNGLAWSSFESGTTRTLFGVWGSAPDDVWVTGHGGTILHWDGTAWTRTPTEGLR